MKCRAHRTGGNTHNVKPKIIIIGGGISGLSCAYDLNKKGFNVYNIGSNDKITTFKLSEIIVKKTNSKSKILNLVKKSKVENFVFNIKKASNHLKYKPRLPIKKKLQMLPKHSQFLYR